MDGMLFPLGPSSEYGMEPMDTVSITEDDENIMGAILHFGQIGLFSRWLLQSREELRQ
jgi:hypothetical protein